MRQNQNKYSHAIQFTLVLVILSHAYILRYFWRSAAIRLLAGIPILKN